MVDKVRYWIEISDYDLDTAEAMLRSKRYSSLDLCVIRQLRKFLKPILSLQNQKLLLFRIAYPIWLKKAIFTKHFPMNKRILLTKLNH